ncbi:hypothetical protein ACWD4G_07685 [Streptomyces sp. NPDC002643]
MTAMPPLLTRQQSSRWNGSAIILDAWWYSTVIGARNWARGFIPAQARWATAM